MAPKFSTPYQRQFTQTPIPTVPGQSDGSYPTAALEAEIAAYSAPAPIMGNGNPYMDVQLDAPPVSQFGAPMSLGTNDPIRGNNPYNPIPGRGASNGDPSDYFTLLRGKESSHNYQAVNSRGYLGGYQMREKSLIDAGYVKPGTTKAGLNNPKNWYNGLSKDKFLANPDIQDAAVRAFTEKNKRYLGSTYTNASENERRGLLASAHLIGAGGTKKNMHSVDGNNVSGMDYYNYFTTH